MMSLIEQPNVDVYNHTGHLLELNNLPMDYYNIFFNSSTYTNEKLVLYSKTDDCYKCPFTSHPNIGNSLNFDDPYYFSSKYSSEWRILNSVDNSLVCELKPEVAEFGVYQLEIEPNNCKLLTVVDPVNIYLPIITTFLIFFGISLLIYGIFKYKRQKNNGANETEETQSKNNKRIRSLDTFRGISIVIMIFVNYGGGSYDFLEHATWNGLHVADLVFPWFMWIMGVCIPIAVRSALRRNENRIFLNILRRSAILFLLGICLNTVKTFEELRIFGVLQRFSLCYFFVASLNLFFTKKDLPDTNIKPYQDILMLIPQWGVILVILAIHTVCIFLIDVPDCGAGYLGPGGLHDDGKYMNCTGGATGYIDRKILGEKHIYQWPTSFVIYHSTPFDPEGPFGTLTSIVQVFLGVQAGTILQVFKNHKCRLFRWILWGVVTGLIGGGLCGFSQEDGIIPVNKNLWSLSFVLVTSSFAFLLLSTLYVVIDIKKWWTGKPFLFAGMNATIMYVGHSLTYASFPFQWGALDPQLHFQGLVQATWGTTMWVLVAYWLYSIKFFLSL